MGAEGVEMEGWPSVGGKTVHIDFRGWSRSSKITIVGTWLRSTIGSCSDAVKRQVRIKKQMQ